MLQPLFNVIAPLPVPLFGSVRTASMFACAKSKALPRKLLSWLIVGEGRMVRRRTVFEMNDGALFVTSLFTASFF